MNKDLENKTKFKMIQSSEPENHLRATMIHKIFRTKPVFLRNRALQEKFNFCFSRAFY